MAVERILIRPTLPKALRPDDVNMVEDVSCDLHCEYIVHDYGSADEAPHVEILCVQADFGGRDWVTVPINCFSGRKLLELEALAADHAAERQAEYGKQLREGA
jgi:hypothetical protein